MRLRWLALALGIIAGCDTAADPPASDTRLAGCDVGARPGYFVPSPVDARPAVLGCARLGVSGKRVEFSAHLNRIGGERHVCINPAYDGRGVRGLFIPAICALEPPLARFAVRDAGQPRQGVRGYAFVIWGTAGESTHVDARFAGDAARAAVVEVPPRLAARLEVRPFRLFVVELPTSAACGPVTLHASGSSATARIPALPAQCRRAP